MEHAKNSHREIRVVLGINLLYGYGTIKYDQVFNVTELNVSISYMGMERITYVEDTEN